MNHRKPTSVIAASAYLNEGSGLEALTESRHARTELSFGIASPAKHLPGIFEPTGMICAGGDLGEGCAARRVHDPYIGTAATGLELRGIVIAPAFDLFLGG